jgi:hypothetical protein
MQPDELEARRCRKEKLQWRSCRKVDVVKVDAVKVKGFPRGGLFNIGVYTFFRPHKVTIYLLRTNPTPYRSRHYLHASKDKNTKNRKGLSQESKTF